MKEINDQGNLDKQKQEEEKRMKEEIEFLSERLIQRSDGTVGINIAG